MESYDSVRMKDADWKDYIERSKNEKNDCDHNVE